MQGKLSPEILRSHVLRYTGALRNDIALAGMVGDDCALLDVGPQLLAASCDPITGAGCASADLLVQINANDIACKGADPSWFLVTLIVPNSLGLHYIDDTMNSIHNSCLQHNIAIVGGHTELTDLYKKPILCGTMLGLTHYHLSGKNINDGDIILACGHVGLEGMTILASDHTVLLRKIFTAQELNEIHSWRKDISILKPARILRKYARYLHDATEGGLNGALAETCLCSGLSLELNYDAIPVHNLTQQASQALKFNPLNLISSGLLLAVLSPENVKIAQNELLANGISSSVIGRMKAGTTDIKLDTHEELWEIVKRWRTTTDE